jgi:hypothetical protein
MATRPIPAAGTPAAIDLQSLQLGSWTSSDECERPTSLFRGDSQTEVIGYDI